MIRRNFLKVLGIVPVAGAVLPEASASGAGKMIGTAGAGAMASGRTVADITSKANMVTRSSKSLSTAIRHYLSLKEEYDEAGAVDRAPCDDLKSISKPFKHYVTTQYYRRKRLQSAEKDVLEAFLKVTGMPLKTKDVDFLKGFMIPRDVKAMNPYLDDTLVDENSWGSYR